MRVAPRCRAAPFLFWCYLYWPLHILGVTEKQAEGKLTLPRGTAGGSKKADGPCRAIEIVAVMRLTTSSARPESNFQNRDRSRSVFEIVDQKRVIVRNLNRVRYRDEKGPPGICSSGPTRLKIHWI